MLIVEFRLDKVFFNNNTNNDKLLIKKIMTLEEYIHILKYENFQNK